MIERLGWYFPNIDSHFAKHVSNFPSTKYQQAAIDAAYTFTKNFDNAIDIGANVGLHSVRFSEKFKNVFSFEPVMSNYECLEKNTSHFKNITRFKTGLGEIDKTETISLPISCNNCGAYSIVDFVDSKEELFKEKIKISRLDDFNLAADLIKIDTQGYEIPVLKGGIETLKKYKPTLILEIEFKKPFTNMLSLLTPLGYKCVLTVKKDKIWIHKDNL